MLEQGIKSLFPLEGEVSAKPTKGAYFAHSPSGASRHLPPGGRSEG